MCLGKCNFLYSYQQSIVWYYYYSILRRKYCSIMYSVDVNDYQNTQHLLWNFFALYFIVLESYVFHRFSMQLSSEFVTKQLSFLNL